MAAIGQQVDTFLNNVRNEKNLLGKGGTLAGILEQQQYQGLTNWLCDNIGVDEPMDYLLGVDVHSLLPPNLKDTYDQFYDDYLEPIRQARHPLVIEQPGQGGQGGQSNNSVDSMESIPTVPYAAELEMIRDGSGSNLGLRNISKGSDNGGYIDEHKGDDISTVSANEIANMMKSASNDSKSAITHFDPISYHNQGAAAANPAPLINQNQNPVNDINLLNSINSVNSVNSVGNQSNSRSTVGLKNLEIMNEVADDRSNARTSSGTVEISNARDSRISAMSSLAPYIIKKPVVIFLGIGTYPDIPDSPSIGDLPGVNKDYQNIKKIFWKKFRWNVVFANGNEDDLSLIHNNPNDLSRDKNQEWNNHKLYWTRAQVIDFIKECIKKIETNILPDSLIFCVSSRSTHGGNILTSDRDIVNLKQEIYDKFCYVPKSSSSPSSGCRSLRDKPKIFLFDISKESIQYTGNDKPVNNNNNNNNMYEKGREELDDEKDNDSGSRLSVISVQSNIDAIGISTIFSNLKGGKTHNNDKDGGILIASFWRVLDNNYTGDYTLQYQDMLVQMQKEVRVKALIQENVFQRNVTIKLK